MGETVRGVSEGRVWETRMGESENEGRATEGEKESEGRKIGECGEDERKRIA